MSRQLRQVANEKPPIVVFSYGNLYVFRNRHVFLFEAPSATSKEEKWKENVNGEEQEESKKKLFGLDQDTLESPPDAVWNLPVEKEPNLHKYFNFSAITANSLAALNFTHLFFPPYSSYNVHPNLSLTCWFKTDGCNKLRGF